MKSVRIEQALGIDGRKQRIGNRRTIEKCLFHRLHQMVVILGAAVGDSGHVEAGQHAHDAERGRPLRRWWRGEKCQAAIVERQRRLDPGGSGGKILRRQRRADGLQPGDDASGKLAFVKLPNTLVGNGAKGFGKCRLALGAICRKCLGKARPCRDLTLPEAIPEILRWADRKAIRRKRNRIVEQACKALLALPFLS